MTPKNQDALEDKINQIRNEYGAHQSSIMGCGYLAEICEAARRFAAIREAVENAQPVLQKIEHELSIHAQLNEGISKVGLRNRENVPVIRLTIVEARSLLRAHGIDPLIDNQGGE